MALPRPLANAVNFRIWACLFFLRNLVILIYENQLGFTNSAV